MMSIQGLRPGCSAAQSAVAIFPLIQWTLRAAGSPYPGQTNRDSVDLEHVASSLEGKEGAATVKCWKRWVFGPE